MVSPAYLRIVCLCRMLLHRLLSTRALDIIRPFCVNLFCGLWLRSPRTLVLTYLTMELVAEGTGQLVRVGGAGGGGCGAG